MTRTDMHRPSAIEPADYDFVAYDYLGPEAYGNFSYLAEQRRYKAEHMARTGGFYSNHEHGGSCHVCGAHAIYTATFWHRPTNSYIHTGLDCAEKLGHGEAEDFRRKVRDAIEAYAGVRKAKALIFEKFENREANRLWGLYNAPWENLTTANGTMPYEELTIRDIVGRLVKYGNISEAQARFLPKLLEKIDNREVEAARRAAEREAAAPCPTGRVAVRGKVLSIRSQESPFGIVTKMLVQSDAGWKVWGTKPAALSEAKVGARVQFLAQVEPSRDDAKFGFYKRPSQAALLENAA